MNWVLIILLCLVLFGVLFIGFLLLRSKPKENTSLLIQQQIEALREQVRLSLEGNTDRITGQLNQRLDNAANTVRDLSGKMIKMEEATRQVLEVSKDISSLQHILKAPKLRGNMSEQFLGDLLAQMLPQEHYETQYTFNNGERVDAVIRTAQKIVPVDAKFPLENFQRLIACDNEEEKVRLRKLFASDVKKHINDIAKKYILPNEGTFDFAMMYIPAENVYYEIITKDLQSEESVSISNYALQKKVIPVSPNTFCAYLSTILLGLKGMQVEKRAAEILQEIGKLRQQIGRFHDDFSKIGTHLGNASTSFSNADKRLSRLKEQLGSLEALPSETEESREAFPTISTSIELNG